MSVDVGFVKAHLLTNLVPSTLAYYLGLRLEIVKVPWDLHASTVDFLTDNHGNSLMSLDC